MNGVTTEKIRQLWFRCYGEDLKTEYEGFYEELVELEKDNNAKDVSASLT
jgi:hypothetical protein